LVITQLNGLNTRKDKIAEIKTILLNKWLENLGVNIVEQIKNYGKEVDAFMQNDSPIPYEFKKNKQK